MENTITQPSYYFYDFETFGINSMRDRPCQFAGIRTDLDFNPIGDPLVIYCKPIIDYLPTPEACFITGITPQLAYKEGLIEPEFMAKIHQQLSMPNTCTIGYNNIRFDDEVVRFNLYRNFFDAYSWSWQQGNSRWDLLDVMRTCYALRPEGINWPKVIDSQGIERISFKLEHLSVANHIEHSNAHDALADVWATIALAKLVKEKQSKLFDYLYHKRSKKALQPLIDLVNLKPLMHVSGMLGIESSYTSWIVPLAWHPTNSNAVICVNLAQDISPLLSLDSSQLHERLYTKHQDLTLDQKPIPIKLVHLNKCPVLAEAKTLRPQDAERLGINRDFCLNNLALLKQNAQIRQKLVDLYSREKEHQPLSADYALYQGFFSDSDRAVMNMIRETKPEHLTDFILHATDPRIKPLLFRYRARHFPMTLSEQEQLQWQLHCREFFEHNLPEYLIHLENLTHEYEEDDKKMTIIKALYRYAEFLTQG